MAERRAQGAPPDEGWDDDIGMEEDRDEVLTSGEPGDPLDDGKPYVRRGRHVPYIRFLLYYAALVAVAAALVHWVPFTRQAFVAQLITADGGTAADFLTGGAAPGGVDPTGAPGVTLGVEGIVERSIVTFLAILGALALVLPAAWVYMFTRRLRYDPSLVHTTVILPVVVAAVVIIVKNSLALAFSLAGIVAAVRFRTTVKDPKDAVYVFVGIGLGLAAGVQALDVALVMSLAFGLVVLTLWKFDPGSIYTGGPGRKGILSIGDPTLLMAQSRKSRTEIRERLLPKSEGMKTDGVLLVHAHDPSVARRAVEVSLSPIAKEWRVLPSPRTRSGVSTLEYIVRLKKKGDPVRFLGELEERWSAQILAAEYVPFKTKKND